MDQVCEEYLKQVKKNLVGTAKEKKEFMTDMRDVVSEYVADKSNICMDELCVHFGLPNDVAEEFAATSLDKRDIKAKSMAIKRIATVAVIIAVIMAILVIGIHLINLWESEQFRSGFFVETVSQGDPSIPLESHLEEFDWEY